MYDALLDGNPAQHIYHFTLFIDFHLVTSLKFHTVVELVMTFLNTDIIIDPAVSHCYVTINNAPV